MNNPLVSIIIPTYNRAHLIGETLDSVLAQTYSRWECIVVDDGSTDKTAKLLATYCEKDERFQYYKRPIDRIKGANACRNYGFEKSKGDFVIWFDSDDLMVLNHIALKVEQILKNNVDFVISQTTNFKDNKLQEPYKYSKPAYGITAEDFILRKIHWYTYDVMLSRAIATKISYHEKMKSWQDYYYFCQMLLITTKGHYINVVLTQRRLHDVTIQSEMTRTKVDFNKALLEAKVLTYIDIKDKVANRVKKEFLFGLINISYYLILEKKIPRHFMFLCKEIKKEIGIKSVFYFFIALLFGFVFKRGDFLLNKTKEK
jgi:glycosyltransferase involved in cell wall biosynthesis